MIFVTYRCGCREEGARTLGVCPIHGQSVESAFVLGARAAELTFGERLLAPDRPLFRPNLEASGR